MKTKAKSLSFYKKKSNKYKEDINHNNNINNNSFNFCSNSNKCNNSDINNNIDNNDINNKNNNLNDINDLKNYEQFLSLFEKHGFESSIIEYESERSIGNIELKPNEIFQIEQILNSGGRSINIFVNGSRFYINIANNHFIKASNETSGVVIQRTKTKFIIAMYQLIKFPSYEVNCNFSTILESISEYNKDDFITCLI